MDESQIETSNKILYQFCTRQPFKLRGFNITESKLINNQFAMIIYCKKNNYNDSHIPINLLSKQLKQKLPENTKISMGIGMMHNQGSESFDTWISRAMKNHQCISNQNDSNGINTKMNYNIHIGIGTVIERMNGVVLGNKKDFEAKVKEIVSERDDNMVVAIFNVDSVNLSINDVNDDTDDSKKVEMDKLIKVGIEVIKLISIFVKDNDKDKVKYVQSVHGYKLSDDSYNGEFGLIIFDDTYKNNDSKCILSSQEIIHALMGNISYQCDVTISAGFTRLDVSNYELTTASKLLEQVNTYSSKAKENGPSCLCYQQNVIKFEMEMSDDVKVSETDFKTGDSGHGDPSVCYCFYYPCTNNFVWCLLCAYLTINFVLVFVFVLLLFVWYVCCVTL